MIRNDPKEQMSFSRDSSSIFRLKNPSPKRKNLRWTKDCENEKREGRKDKDKEKEEERKQKERKGNKMKIWLDDLGI